MKAGTQTEMYSAPSAPGVLYRTQFPGSCVHALAAPDCYQALL